MCSEYLTTRHGAAESVTTHIHVHQMRVAAQLSCPHVESLVVVAVIRTLLVLLRGLFLFAGQSVCCHFVKVKINVLEVFGGARCANESS